MRRSVLLFTPLLPLGLWACEDGPNQTFQPATGTLFNNGDAPAVVADGGAPFNATFGGQSKQEICTGDELQQQWSRMIAQPVRPPRFMAGIDLQGGTTFPGLTVETAESGPLTAYSSNAPTKLCQATYVGPGPDGGSIGGAILVQWGNNGEVQMEWAVPTHKAYEVVLNLGYVGHMQWEYTTKDGKHHTYDWALGQVTQRDSQPFYFDWELSGSTADCTSGKPCGDEVDELYRGIVSTFAPELYVDTPTDCLTNGTCAVFPTGNDGIHPIIGFRPAAFYMNTFSPFQSHQAGSTMWQAYAFSIKFAPYSLATTTLKMDSIGPTASATLGKGRGCNLALGDTFANLMSNCIQVFPDQATNDTALAKVLGNLAHDDQNFTFSVVGVNQNYFPKSLQIGGSRQFDVIHDGETPAANPTDNVAGDFTFDVRASGPILNDAYVDPTSRGYVKDYHGSGAVWREWGRLVQETLARDYAATHTRPASAKHWPRAWHDEQCYFPMHCTGGAACGGLDFDQCAHAASCSWGLPAKGSCVASAIDAGDEGACPAHADATSCTADATHACTWWDGPQSWRNPPGCTGFEGMVSDAFPDATETDQFGYSGQLGLGGFKPGDPYAMWCNDPGMLHFCGSSGDATGITAPILDGSLQRVLQFLGYGDVNDVPAEGRDLRFFFKQYTIANAKYLLSPAASVNGPNGNPPQAIPDFRAQFLDEDYLVFDSYGANAARSEYIDYTHAGEKDQFGTVQDPTDVELQWLLIGSNAQSETFYRRMDREERALFEAMAVDPSQPAWAWLRDASGKPVPEEWVIPEDGKTHFNRVNADMFLTNIAGSSILAGLYSDVVDANKNLVDAPPGTVDDCKAPGAPAKKTAYYCATHVDSQCKLHAPTDDAGRLLTRENGKPLLAGYCGIWKPTAFSLGSDIGFEIESTDPMTQTAKVKVSDYDDPYDLTSSRKQIEVLFPWKPNQEGVGYPVANPAAPTEDVFVQTAQFDLTGQVVTPVFDFLDENKTSDAGAPVHKASIQAIETEDFLGDVFLCVDQGTTADRKGTHRPGDILAAHMYTSVATILEWIASHPGAQDQCQIIVRYSPFNNYPDYIQSTAAGVRLGIDQASGYGRVTDVTVFAAGTGTPSAP